jgi:hypothetical protein
MELIPKRWEWRILEPLICEIVITDWLNVEVDTTTSKKLNISRGINV